MARKVLQLNSRLSATGFQTGSGQALSFYRSATNPLHVAIFDFHSHTFDSHYNTFCHALSHFATFCNDHRLWQTAALLWRPRLSWPRLEAVNQTGAPYSRPPSRDPWSTGMLCQGFHMFRHYAQTFLIAAFHNLDSMDFVLKGLSMKRDRKHITLTYIPSTYIYIYIYIFSYIMLCHIIHIIFDCSASDIFRSMILQQPRASTWSTRSTRAPGTPGAPGKLHEPFSALAPGQARTLRDEFAPPFCARAVCDAFAIFGMHHTLVQCTSALCHVLVHACFTLMVLLSSWWRWLIGYVGCNIISSW